MSIRPINIIMAITNSQHLKSSESDPNIQHLQKINMTAEHNVKIKETVSRIRDDETDTQQLDIIKQGMPESQSESYKNQHKNDKKEENLLKNKELLNNDETKHIDIFG